MSEARGSKTRRRARLLTASLCLVVGGVVLVALGLTEGQDAEPEAGPPPRLDPTPSQKRREPPKKTRRVESDDRPRSRLPPSHRPASGRAVARLEIPAIGVRAPVIRLGLNPDRTLQVPANAKETGWWTGGARPGERGPAVIACHVDSRSGPGVFYRLRELRAGDRVRVVYRDAPRALFEVTSKRRASKGRFPRVAVYGGTREPTLRLITCSGTFDHSTGHYRDNLIVFARKA